MVQTLSKEPCVVSVWDTITCCNALQKGAVNRPAFEQDSKHHPRARALDNMRCSTSLRFDVVELAWKNPNTSRDPSLHLSNKLLQQSRGCFFDLLLMFLWFTFLYSFSWLVLVLISSFIWRLDKALSDTPTIKQNTITLFHWCCCFIRRPSF